MQKVKMLEWFNQHWYKIELENDEIKLMMALGPQNAGKGQVSSAKGVQQNKGFPMARNILGPAAEFNKQAQAGAADSQSANQGTR